MLRKISEERKNTAALFEARQCLCKLLVELCQVCVCSLVANAEALDVAVADSCFRFDKEVCAHSVFLQRFVDLCQGLFGLLRIICPDEFRYHGIELICCPFGAADDDARAFDIRLDDKGKYTPVFDS